jgi:hypothetical protein
MCVVADAPLPVETRIGVVNLAVEHELLARHCEVSVPAVLPPRGIVARVKYLFGHRQTYFQRVEDGPPGPWLADRVRSLETDFDVHSRSPRWSGEDVTGPFVYHASHGAAGPDLQRVSPRRRALSARPAGRRDRPVLRCDDARREARA